MTENQLPSRKSNSLFFIVIILFLAGIIVYQFYLREKDKEILDIQEITINEKSEDLSKVSTTLDSMRTELEEKIQEIKKLGGDTASIANLKREIERDLKNSKAKNKRSLALISNLRDKIEIYELQLSAKDQEIEKLKNDTKNLSNENKGLKNQVVEKEDAISKLAEEKTKLSQQVAIASKLRAETVRISIIDSKGKEREEEDYKARKIGKLKISFTIADNPVAQIGSKEVFLRITGPEGETLGDLSNGGGTFSYEGRESPYSSRLSFLFDNKQAPPSFIWEKGSNFTTGTYTVELFSEGYRLGQANFKVR